MCLLSFLQPRSRCALLLLYLAGLLASATAAAQTLATSVPLVTPSVIAFDARGNLYIAETAKHIIRKVDLAGQISTIAGTGTQGFAGDGGQAAAALLDSPQGLAVDPSSLYIADTHNNRIRKVDLVTGIITTIAGGAIIGTAEDGGPAVTATTLDTPTAIALDANENLYIAEVRRHRIRKIAAASGIITTVAGTGTQGFDGDGNAATAALIDSPGGLAVDSSGNIFLADSHNHRVRRIDAITGAITTLAGNAAGYAGDAGSAVTSRLALPQGCQSISRAISILLIQPTTGCAVSMAKRA
jgi:sugar lactone lactonase YvrE